MVGRSSALLIHFFLDRSDLIFPSLWVSSLHHVYRRETDVGIYFRHKLIIYNCGGGYVVQLDGLSVGTPDHRIRHVMQLYISLDRMQELNTYYC